MKFFRYITNILIFVDLIFFVSCNETTKQDILLNEALLLADENPVKASFVLDSIDNPSTSLSKENYMKYLIIATQVKSKNRQNVENDTLIDNAISFYQTHKDDKLLIKAYFYGGNIFTLRDEREKAFRYYLKALDLSVKNGDELFEAKSLYNLGYHYYYNNIKDSAAIYWKKSLHIFQHLQEKQNMGQNLYMLALIAFQNHENGKSTKYAEQALAIAKEIEDKQTLFWANNLLGILVQETKNDSIAITYLNNALSNATQISDSSKVYMNIADLYIGQSRFDSATHYTRILEKRISHTDDLYTLRSMHLTLENYYKLLDKYETANIHSDIAEKLNKLIEQKKITKQIFELDKQYTIYKYKQQESYNKKKYMFVGFLMILCLSLIFYRNIKLRRKMNSLEDEINRITKQM